MVNRFYYDAISLDRAPHLRRHPEWSVGAPQEGDARVLPIWRDQNMVIPGEPPSPVFMNRADGAAVGLRSGGRIAARAAPSQP